MVDSQYKNKCSPGEIHAYLPSVNIILIFFFLFLKNLEFNIFMDPRKDRGLCVIPC